MLETLNDAFKGISLSREDADYLIAQINALVLPWSNTTNDAAFVLLKRLGESAPLKANRPGAIGTGLGEVSWTAVERGASRADLDALASSTKQDARKLDERITKLESAVKRLFGNAY